MRVLVYPHTMAIGGTINAIEIAAAVRDRGHEVTLLARPGPLLREADSRGLDRVGLDGAARRRPSFAAVRQLNRLARELRLDLIHTYEWPPAVEACAGPRWRLGVPAVATIYSERVAPFLPRGLPLILAAQKYLEAAAGAGHTPVSVIEPPVDIHANSPDFGPGPFRSGLGFDDAPLIVAVTRLSHESKLEGLLAACDAVARLAISGVKAQFAVVGDGAARGDLEEAAAAANAAAGRRVVALTGELADPRPAYAAADVVVGMGGSAVRGMAFGKPLIVQGVHGFWRLLTPDTAPEFLDQGWYGVGPPGTGRAESAACLERVLRDLLEGTAERERLGSYARSLVTARLSLERAAVAAEEVYAAAVAGAGRPHARRAGLDAVSSWTGAVRHQARRRWQRRRGIPVPLEDFNGPPPPQGRS